MNSNTCKILLIDDDHEDQWLVKRSFEASGRCQLEVVNNGAEALQLLRDTTGFSPDVILLDLNMPVMDGPTFLQHFYSDRSIRRIPIIVLTTSNLEEHVWKCYELGASAYIVKPATFEKFKTLAVKMEGFWCDCVERPPGRSVL